MYNSPNKSLELATLKRTLMTEMGRTKSGRVTKKRRRKRAYKSTAPKVSQNKTDRPTKWTTYWPTNKTKYKVAHPHLHYLVSGFVFVSIRLQNNRELEEKEKGKLKNEEGRKLNRFYLKKQSWFKKTDSLDIVSFLLANWHRNDWNLQIIIFRQ